MNIPPVQALRADPGAKARAAYTKISHTNASTGRILPLRDRFSLSDEARLREEYGLRLMKEGGQAEGGAERLSALPTLADMARAYASFWDEIRQAFRDNPSLLTSHAQALDSAWRDTLDMLAQLAAERLARREGDPRAANVPLLRELIAGAHRMFADTFCTSYPLLGLDGAVSTAAREAVKTLTLVTNQELSLSDTMALLFYRRGLERNIKSNY